MLKFDQETHIVTKRKAPNKPRNGRRRLSSDPAAPHTAALARQPSHPRIPRPCDARRVLPQRVGLRKAVQRSDSTDVGDFVRDAARAAKFCICIGYDPAPRTQSEVLLDVEVPTVADRTRFLRRRLAYVERELKKMEEMKHACDREARHVWGTVARLTFWDYGWDVMEPITYLSGLSTIWFLYQGCEVSYSSVLDRSISARREALYKTRGFDIERWMDLDYEHPNPSSGEDEDAERDAEKEAHKDADVNEAVEAEESDKNSAKWCGEVYAVAALPHLSLRSRKGPATSLLVASPASHQEWGALDRRSRFKSPQRQAAALGRDGLPGYAQQCMRESGLHVRPAGDRILHGPVPSPPPPGLSPVPCVSLAALGLGFTYPRAAS
ncbi:hypothetical protein B0H15DRAFT_961655 [Mycena belliarum]|uniref:Calcium uniporter protein, mitochondrial n=1 Tax=Mycena belliarum TaxID=1033014 RepID=A0AAD6XR56_9AGAR|nr:hypothetical protein B0H15DRAFT_961655 [Mycena belliae]